MMQFLETIKAGQACLSAPPPKRPDRGLYSILKPASMSLRQFYVTEEPFGNHYHAISTDTEGDERHLFIENSPETTDEGDIILRDGTDISAPAIGSSKFRRRSLNCDVKLDDEEDWRPMRRNSLKGLVTPVYSFEAPVDGKVSRLVWKKTRSMGTFSSGYSNSKLVDVDTQEVLAVFSSDPQSLVTGRLDLYGDFGDSFDRMALLTGLSVREKSRRQSTSSMRHGRDDVYTAGAGVGRTSISAASGASQSSG